LSSVGLLTKIATASVKNWLQSTQGGDCGSIDPCCLSARLLLCSKPRTGFPQCLKDSFCPTRPTLHSYCLHQELAAVDQQWWIVSLLIFSPTRIESRGQASTWLGKFPSELLIQMNSTNVCWKEDTSTTN